MSKESFFCQLQTNSQNCYMYTHVHSYLYYYMMIKSLFYKIPVWMKTPHMCLILGLSELVK